MFNKEATNDYPGDYAPSDARLRHELSKLRHEIPGGWSYGPPGAARLAIAVAPLLKVILQPTSPRDRMCCNAYSSVDVGTDKIVALQIFDLDHNIDDRVAAIQGVLLYTNAANPSYPLGISVESSRGPGASTSVCLEIRPKGELPVDFDEIQRQADDLCTEIRSRLEETDGGADPA